MKKILVVSEHECVRLAMAKVVSLVDYEASVASHKDALAKFFDEEPQAVIILDYDEAHGAGRATYNDIKSSAQPRQKIVRCGFPAYDYADYVREPFRLAEIIEKIS